MGPECCWPITPRRRQDHPRGRLTLPVSVCLLRAAGSTRSIRKAAKMAQLHTHTHSTHVFVFTRVCARAVKEKHTFTTIRAAAHAESMCMQECAKNDSHLPAEACISHQTRSCTRIYTHGLKAPTLRHQTLHSLLYGTHMAADLIFSYHSGGIKLATNLDCERHR